MSEHLTPCAVAELLIGPPEALGKICGTHSKSPYQWRSPSNYRAAGDIPHPVHMRSLLAHSAAHELGLTADHLIWGASRAEIDHILACRAMRQAQQIRAAE